MRQMIVVVEVAANEGDIESAPAIFLFHVERALFSLIIV